MEKIKNSQTWSKQLFFLGGKLQRQRSPWNWPLFFITLVNLVLFEQRLTGYNSSLLFFIFPLSCYWEILFRQEWKLLDNLSANASINSLFSSLISEDNLNVSSARSKHVLILFARAPKAWPQRLRKGWWTREEGRTAQSRSRRCRNSTRWSDSRKWKEAKL